MKFVAKRLDLAVELEGLDGEARKLCLRAPLSADAASKLLDRIVSEEAAYKESVSPKKKESANEESSSVFATDVYAKSVDFLDRQLCDIYDTETGYWKNNFDRETLVQVKQYVIDELMGLRKKS